MYVCIYIYVCVCVCVCVTHSRLMSENTKLSVAALWI